MDDSVAEQNIMANEWDPLKPPKPKRRWPRRIAWGAVGLSIFLVVAYLFVTSFLFLKMFVLPQVRAQVNGPVEVADARVSLFFGVTLRGVKVGGTPFEEPLARVDELRVRHSLLDILRGRIHLKEVWVAAPVIQLIEYEDGTSNLDRLLKPSSTPKAASTPSGPGSVPQIFLEKFGLTNASVRYVKVRAGGKRDTIDLQNIHVALANLGNGRSGTLRLGGNVKLDQAGGAAGTNSPGGTLQASLAGGFEFGLSDKLQPENARGNLSLAVSGATQAFGELKGMNATLDCDLTPAELRQLTLAFARGGQALGRINVSGPLDVGRQEGDLRIEISSIDRQALNLAGAPFGLDFGSTKVNSSHHVVLTSGGQSMRAVGNVKLNELSVAQKGAATQPLDLQLDYDVTLNRAEQWLLVQRFTLSGTQNAGPLLAGALTEPMRLSLGGGTNATADSAFTLTVTNLQLADWQAFVGDCRGTVGLNLSLLAKEAGQKISLDLGVTGENLTVAAGSNAPPRADVLLRLRARLDDQRKAQLDEFRVELLDRRQPFVTVAASGSYDLKSQVTDARSQLDVALPSAARWLGRPELELSAGSLKLETQLQQQALTPDGTNQPGLSQSATARFRLEGLTGRLADSRLDRFEIGFDLEASMQEQRAEFKKFTGFLKHGGENAGTFELAGSARLSDQTADATLKVTDLNQHALQPFLASALGDKKLANVSISLSATAQSGAPNECGFNAQLKVADLMITDPAGQLPKVPLTAEMKLAGTLRQDVAEIRELSGSIRQGDLAGGSFLAQGRYDLKGQMGALSCKLIDLNQHALRPLLAPALGDKVIESISIGLDADAEYQARGESSVKAELRLGHLVVRDPKRQFPATPIDVEVGLNALLLGDVATVKRLATQLKLADQPGGSLNLTARYDVKKHSAAGTLKLTDLNENALRPFLSAGIAGKTLSSISINADVNAGYATDGRATLDGDFGVSKLVLLDSQSKQAGNPLGAEVHLQGTFARQLLTLEDLQLKLSPTARARNVMTLTGRVDLARSNLIGGELQLAVESLDLTAYHEAFCSPSSPAGAGPAASKDMPPTGSPSPPTPRPNAEPAAVQLPFDDFIFGLKIGQFHVGDLAARDWQTSLKLNGGKVVLKPMQLVMNGAPVSASADLDLGVPGFRYDVTLLTDKLPVAPLVDTFAPELRGQYKGNLIVNTQVKGAGVTGMNLRTNLGGRVAFSLTNADFKIASPRLKAFFLPIGVVLGLPDLLNAPVSSVAAAADLGSGKIQVTSLDVVSDSFRADTQGGIKIADVLDDSPIEKWPVHFQVRRAAADRLRLTPKGTPADAPYAKLPDFIKVAGTVGEPKAELSKGALGSAVAEKLFDKATGGKANSGRLNPLDLLKKPGP